MPSTFSLRERFELQADGENDSTWGQKANVVFQLIDEALSGYLSKSVAGTGNITLTANNSLSDEVRQNVINLTGLLTGARNVIVPTQEGEWFFVNNTTGAFTLTVKPVAGTGIAVLQGFAQRLFCDGTNVLASGPEIAVATGLVNTAQPLDTDLTALAAVTIATDQIIYGTGAATWGTSTITAFARSFLDDADAAAGRVTLNAAGLNISNTFTANQTVESTDAGPGVGPSLRLDRNSASPAVSDVIGDIQYVGRSSTGVSRIYGRILSLIVDPTNAAEDGDLELRTIVAGTDAGRLRIRSGLFTTGATGGDQGAGTLNVQNGLFVRGVALNVLFGLTLSNGTDATNDIDIATGLCSDDAQSQHLRVASAIGKQIDVSWAAGGTPGTPTGGLSSSLTLTNNTWYHVILGLVAGVPEVGFDTSITGANLVIDHSFTSTRRIGSVRRVGATNIAFFQRGDRFYWTTPVDVQKIPTATAALFTVEVPPIAVIWIAEISHHHTATQSVIVSSPLQADVTPLTTRATLHVTASSQRSVAQVEIPTDDSQIRHRGTTTGGNLHTRTLGYIDRRGRDS